jgi:hypothetical protein
MRPCSLNTVTILALPSLFLCGGRVWRSTESYRQGFLNQRDSLRLPTQRARGRLGSGSTPVEVVRSIALIRRADHTSVVPAVDQVPNIWVTASSARRRVEAMASESGNAKISSQELLTQIGVLWRECIEGIRTCDPPAVWHQRLERIARLRDQLGPPERLHLDRQ